MPTMMQSTKTPANLPETQQAITQDAEGRLVISNMPLPQLQAGMVLVKTAAVALNPADYKIPMYFPSPGATSGLDFSGTVVHIPYPISAPLQVGSRVCGAVYGSNPIDHATGAFAEYVRVDADLLIEIPRSMTWELAAAVGGVGHGTLCIALWESLGLPGRPEKPTMKSPPVLVFGGSTATGTLAIQLLKMSGFSPITTCSPHNFDLVKSFGATAVFDYKSPTCASDIRQYTHNALSYALDCVTDFESTTICYAALGRAGGRYTCLEACPLEWRTRRAVKMEFVIGLEIFGKEVVLGMEYSRVARADRREAYVKWTRTMQRLLDEGRIKGHPLKVMPEGWGNVVKGVELLKKGGLSGQKIVVPVG